MTQISYLKKRGGTYYAQTAVPLDVQPIIGAKMKERSLRTKANRIAVDSLADGMKELSLRADEWIQTGGGSAAESFKRLGYDAAELKTKLQDPSALFTEIIGKLGKLDKAAQIRIADELFGGNGGEKFVQLIGQGADGIRATIQEAHNLGAVIDSDVIARAAELDRKFNAVSVTVGTALKTAIVEAASALARFVDEFRAFENRGTGSLKTRFGELQTRKQQLQKQKGTTEDYALSFIGKDAATEMKAVQAEMDQVAAELRKRATPQLSSRRIGTLFYSPHTASSFPAGSTKWNRLPPGNEKIGLTIFPPAFSTAPRVSSRSFEYSTGSGFACPSAASAWKPPSMPSLKAE